MPNDAITLYYEEHGQGLPVIFLHGFPFDHTSWEPLVPLLRDHARLILPDLRGFGRSPASPDPMYTMRMFADDIHGLINQLGIDKAVLVGHSMGGYIALAFARAYPNHLAGLGLVGTQARADTPERRAGRKKTADAIKRRGLERATEGMAEKYVANPALVPAVRQQILKANPQAAIAALKGMAERQDSTDLLPTITAPAVVIAGEADQMVPLERARTLNQLLPWSWLVEIPGCGHLMPLEAPEATADALHKFFHTVEGRKEA